MRCVALLSGGKDSVLATEVARQQGRDVVAALVLRPAEDDAWLFHTPNLDVAAAVGECMGLPVIEAPCSTGPDAEVEDLQAALAAVQRAHGVKGVVSGALASEYQRTRIERVGHALGLRTFTPLWHKDVDAYMQTFLGPGWDVRFARVACDGMDASWAGARLDARAVAFLRGLRSRPHLAGEGGEYETLVLAAPGWQRRIEVDAADVEATASRATWRVRRWRIVPVGSA